MARGTAHAAPATAARGGNSAILEKLAAEEQRLEWERARDELLTIKRALVERDAEVLQLKTTTRKLHEALQKKDRDVGTNVARKLSHDIGGGAQRKPESNPSGMLRSVQLQQVFAVLRAPSDAELTKKRRTELIERLLMETQQRVVNAEAIAEERKKELDRLKFSSKFLRYQELEIEVEECHAEIARLRADLSSFAVVGKLKVSRELLRSRAESGILAGALPTPTKVRRKSIAAEHEMRVEDAPASRSEAAIPMVLSRSQHVRPVSFGNNAATIREGFVDKTRRRAVEAEYLKQMRLAELEAQCELEENLHIRVKREARAQAEMRRKVQHDKKILRLTLNDAEKPEPSRATDDTGAVELHDTKRGTETPILVQSESGGAIAVATQTPSTLQMPRELPIPEADATVMEASARAIQAAWRARQERSDSIVTLSGAAAVGDVTPTVESIDAMVGASIIVPQLQYERDGFDDDAITEDHDTHQTGIEEAYASEDDIEDVEVQVEIVAASEVGGVKGTESVPVDEVDDSELEGHLIAALPHQGFVVSLDPSKDVEFANANQPVTVQQKQGFLEDVPPVGGSERLLPSTIESTNEVAALDPSPAISSALDGGHAVGALEHEADASIQENNDVGFLTQSASPQEIMAGTLGEFRDTIDSRTVQGFLFDVPPVKSSGTDESNGAIESAVNPLSDHVHGEDHPWTIQVAHGETIGTNKDVDTSATPMLGLNCLDAPDVAVVQSTEGMDMFPDAVAASHVDATEDALIITTEDTPAESVASSGAHDRTNTKARESFCDAHETYTSNLSMAQEQDDAALAITMSVEGHIQRANDSSALSSDIIERHIGSGLETAQLLAETDFVAAGQSVVASDLSPSEMEAAMDAAARKIQQFWRDMERKFATPIVQPTQLGPDRETFESEGDRVDRPSDAMESPAIEIPIIETHQADSDEASTASAQSPMLTDSDGEKEGD